MSTSKPLRVLVGTYEICRHAFDLAEGFRRLGHEADTVMYYINPQHGNLGYTHFELPSEIHSTMQLIRQNSDRALALRPQAAQRILKYLRDYDVYVFQFASSLLPNNADLPLLKRGGKRVISLFNGSDTRHWSSSEPVWEHYGLKVPSMYREEPHRRLNPRILNMRMAERYSDAAFALPSHAELAIRPYYHFYIPVDVGLYTPYVPLREKPVIVHAPSRRATKGTEQFLRALDVLDKEGVKFELRLLEGRSNQEVIEELQQADIVLDQLDSSTYGMLALEAMATGCAVASGNEPNFIPLPADRPAAHVDSVNVVDVIRRLIMDRPYRAELANAGRGFVERYHAVESVATRLLDSLDVEAIPDYFPTFFAERYELPENETILPALQRLTTEVVSRHGLPEGTSAHQMAGRGLMAMPDEGTTPELQWRPWTRHARREFWGWCPDHTTEEEAEEDPAGQIVEWVRRALKAVDLADHDAAHVLLQRCIDCGAAHPAALEERIVLMGIGHLAEALGNHEHARHMFDAAEAACRQAA